MLRNSKLNRVPNRSSNVEGESLKLNKKEEKRLKNLKRKVTEFQYNFVSTKKIEFQYNSEYNKINSEKQYFKQVPHKSSIIEGKIIRF